MAILFLFYLDFGSWVKYKLFNCLQKPTTDLINGLIQGPKKEKKKKEKKGKTQSLGKAFKAIRQRQ